MNYCRACVDVSLTRSIYQSKCFLTDVDVLDISCLNCSAFFAVHVFNFLPYLCSDFSYSFTWSRAVMPGVSLFQDSAAEHSSESSPHHFYDDPLSAITSGVFVDSSSSDCDSPMVVFF